MRLVPILGAASLLAVGCGRGGIDKTSPAYQQGYSCGKVNASSPGRLSATQMVEICSHYATADDRSGDGLKNYRAGVRDGASG